jgi:hypothetical protein
MPIPFLTVLLLATQDPQHSEDCPKSCGLCAKPLDKAVAHLASRMSKHPFKSQMNDHQGIVASSVVGLAFHASATHKKHLQACRDHVASWAGKAPKFTWEPAYAAIFLSEVERAQSSPAVKTALKKLVEQILKAQQEVGGWGHTHKGPIEGIKRDYPYPKTLTASTIFCLAALSAAKECGIPVDQGSLDKGAKYLERTTSKGAMGYSEEYGAWATHEQAASRAAASLVFLPRLRDPGDAWVAALDKFARDGFDRISPVTEDKHPYALFFLAAGGMHARGPEAWKKTEKFRAEFLKLQKPGGAWGEERLSSPINGRNYSLFGDYDLYLTATYAIVLSLPLGNLSMAKRP